MRMGLACFILRQFMAVGRLSIAIADGPMQHIKACDSGPDVAIRLAHRGVLWRLILCPDLAFGESYMDGDLQIESARLMICWRCLLPIITNGTAIGSPV